MKEYPLVPPDWCVIFLVAYFAQKPTSALKRTPTFEDDENFLI